ncbi:MAG TPA: hypothetical protein VJP79_03540, partial [Nitrososphaera sp.]|nr:hypothetical protein [Nitrososphaera sp.]
MNLPARKYLLSSAIMLAGLSVVLIQWPAVLGLQPSFASENTWAAVAPFFQLPGGSALVTAEGLAPNSTVTIYAKNVVATVETEKAGEATKSVTFPDTVTI